MELHLLDVKGLLTAPADVSAFLEEIVLLAGEWAFRPFVDDDARLFGSELLQRSHDLIISPRILSTTSSTGTLVSISRSAPRRSSGSTVCFRARARASTCGSLPYGLFVRW